MFASALGLAALAFVLIRTSKRIRGYLRYSDAIFPLALLNFGHANNLLQGLNSLNPTVTILAGVLLAVIARSRGPCR